MTRRAALTGTAGVGLVGLLGAWAAPADAAPAAATPRTLTTTVAVPTGGVRGRRTVGAPFAHRLDLYGPDGTRAGELVVTGTVLAVRGAAADTAAVHHHLLRMPGGTLAGHGTVDLAGHGEFVVVGGTGHLLGATGAYRLDPGPASGSTLTWKA